MILIFKALSAITCVSESLYNIKYIKSWEATLFKLVFQPVKCYLCFVFVFTVVTFREQTLPPFLCTFGADQISTPRLPSLPRRHCDQKKKNMIMG